MTSMAEISSENDEFFKMEQVKIDWGRWKKWILGPKVDTNSALMWLLHGRDAKSKPQHGVSSGSNIAPSQDTASPWHAESGISQDHETNQSPRQSIAVAGVFIAMPSCLDPPEVVGIGRWWGQEVWKARQTKVCLTSDDSGNVARFYYAHMGHYLSQWSAWTSTKCGQKLPEPLLLGFFLFLFGKMQCSTGILHLHVIQPWFFTLLFRSNLLVTSQVVRLWYSKSW